MKKLALIFATIFMLCNIAFAEELTTNKKSHKKYSNQKTQLTEKISNMLGYPSNILDGTSQAVMISYLVDGMNVIHIQEILSPNAELTKYVLKKLDNKKLKHVDMEGKTGVVKVHFIATKNQKLNFQY